MSEWDVIQTYLDILYHYSEILLFQYANVPPFQQSFQ